MLGDRKVSEFGVPQTMFEAPILRLQGVFEAYNMKKLKPSCSEKRSEQIV